MQTLKVCARRESNADRLKTIILQKKLGDCTAFHVRTRKVTGLIPDAAKFTKMFLIFILGQCPGKFCFEGLHSAWDHMGIKKNLGALSQNQRESLICKFLLMKTRNFLKKGAKLSNLGHLKITNLAF